MGGAGLIEAFVPDLDLRPALADVVASGAGYVRSALAPGYLARLVDEVEGGPFRSYREQFAQVRQQIEGFDLDRPFAGFPLIAELCRSVREQVQRQGEAIRGLRTWSINEAGVIRYRPGSIGITSHLDGKRHRRLVVVLSLRGTAEFALCADRSGTVVSAWEPEPGSLTILRGPGLAGRRDGRPFHRVGTPKTGQRLAIGLRMSVPPDRPDPPSP
jgi:hypothetical protein